MSRCGLAHSATPSCWSCSLIAWCSRLANFFTHPVSRKYDWLETFKRRRFASSDKQSWTIMPPFVSAPSESMIPNIRSKAFSNATSFCRSVEEGVSAVSRSKPSKDYVSLLPQYSPNMNWSYRFVQPPSCLQGLQLVLIPQEGRCTRIPGSVLDELTKWQRSTAANIISKRSRGRREGLAGP